MRDMYQLSPAKYVPVYLKRQKIRPWILSSAAWGRLQENASFVQCLAELQKQRTFDKNLTYFHSLYETVPTTHLADEVVLDWLGLVSRGVEPETFKSWEGTQQWQKQAEVVLLTERNLYPATLNLGSGRHCLLKDLQLKGIGRTALSLQDEYTHSWGGLQLRDALKSYMTSLFSQKLSLLGPLKILGVFIYQDLTEPLALQIREANTFRLSQLNPLYLTKNEVQVARAHLESVFPGKSPVEMMQIIFEHYLHAFRHGVKYKSVAPDNLCLDGRWIDTESLDIRPDGSSHEPWFSIKSNSLTSVSPMKGDSCKNVFSSIKDAQFCDSWIHQLHLMCQGTADIFGGLWKGLDKEADHLFLSLLEKYFSHLDLSFWQNLLRAYDSELGLLFGRPGQKNAELSAVMLEEFKLSGFYQNTQIPYEKYTFTPSGNDSFDSMQALVNKWEKAIPVTPHDRQGAESLGELLHRLAGLE